jgi:hypothetical protein
VRRAVESDIPQLIQWGSEFHAASPYADIPYAPERVEATLRQVMQTGIVLVSETGMAAAMLGPLWFSEGVAAQELFWWGDAGLRDGLEEWARENGASLFAMVCLENEKAPVLCRFYRMQGYRPVEHHFLKVL